MVATPAPRVLTTAERTRLVKLRASVLAHYKSHARNHLPWRKTRDPYKILVSEIMLQQTQATRVVPKYKAFIKEFPTARALAASPLKRVLAAWSGLGYNRRAKYLWEAARGGTRGIGPYTANAVRVFAHNEPVTMIETNIRTVYLHHLFPKAKNVPDSKLISYMISVNEEVWRKGIEPRVWYAALMDYGSYLKTKYPNPSRRSAGHTKQKKFIGSDREIRGAILRAHLSHTKVSGFDPKRVVELRKKLKREGLVT